ncbi:C40 family peptidase [Methylotenera sp. 1P/1]|uniref:C40 family peptidase n=1 Tax=Methylotenera sp. 1P/1 TaxID=1131551 RepID=UPI00035C807D|nr:C40 family peptidase [Methylotenera sp. 1P/1]
MYKLLFLMSLLCSNICLADDLIKAASHASMAEETPEAVNTTPTWSDKAQEVLMQALSLTGIQYKYGGKSPETGFDCSGFVRYVFSQATKITLPPTARAISQMGKTVKKDELQPGDLVFFNTLKTAFSHVGIYMGDNKFIHSPSAGGSVRVESMDSAYWNKRFNGAQRIEAAPENPH